MPRFLRPAAAVALTGLVVIVPQPIRSQGSSADPEYVRRVEAWRARHEADYTREYVPLAGLFFLEPGRNAVGSAPTAVVKLPDRAPADVGTMVYERGVVTFEARAGAPVTLAGAPVAAPVVLSPATAGRPADELSVGDLAFWVHMSGARHAIRLRDPQGEPARTFLGFRWFPIDPRYRVVARFTPDPAPREIQVASLTGDDQTFTTEGTVEFELLGAAVRMRPMTTRPGRLYFVFRDATSGSETYAAARFLYADLAADNTAVLDFNEAYNPPCAFNPYTTCPLPLPENRLTIPIRAGERDYPHPPALP